MIYEFQSDDGEILERVFPMRRAPQLGLEILHNGKVFTRRISAPKNGTAYDSEKYPKVSSSLPVGCAGAEHVTGGRHDGKPIITSRRHEDELCARHGFTREYDARDLE